jgi:hypothetical protein
MEEDAEKILMLARMILLLIRSHSFTTCPRYSCSLPMIAINSPLQAVVELFTDD